MSGAVPQIVAIIPLYNGARYIEDALVSAANQTLAPTEILVVDDGSTDDGPNIVLRLKERFPTIRMIRKANGGQSSARNLAVKESSAPLIAFLDQDDIWYPDHLEQMVKPFDEAKRHRLGWVYSDFDIIDVDGLLVSRTLLKDHPSTQPKENLFICLSEEMMIPPSASLIDRDAFEAVGGFDERLSGYEDDDLFLRLFRSGYQNVFIATAHTQWRVYRGSTSWTSRMARSRMIYFHKLRELYPDDPFFGNFYVRDCIAPRFLRRIFGEYRRAVRLKDRGMFATFAENLSEIVPYLPLRRRLPFLLGRPVWRSYALTSLAVNSGLARLARLLF